MLKFNSFEIEYKGIIYNGKVDWVEYYLEFGIKGVIRYNIPFSFEEYSNMYSFDTSYTVIYGRGFESFIIRCIGEFIK